MQAKWINLDLSSTSILNTILTSTDAMCFMKINNIVSFDLSLFGLALTEEGWGTFCFGCVYYETVHDDD